MTGEHVLCTFGGKLGTDPASDTWQCGIRLWNQHVDLSTGADCNLVGLANNIAPAIKTWMTSTVGVYGLIRNDAHLDFVKCAQVHKDAGPPARWKYMATVPNPANGAFVTGTGGTAGTFPWFLSIAFSWTTANTRGPGHTGRIYPPIAFPGTGAAGATLPPAAMVDYVNKAKELLTAVTKSDGAGASFVPVVASLKTGALTLITGVRVGNVIDVQRRRKQQIPETYTAAAWP